mmetsp:Transcript_29587/g.48824  ORF Transcript_29587/g.48824 Transcript_29587/m.48824 type:complete len:321 (-) Transcript_29587:26-988(-)
MSLSKSEALRLAKICISEDLSSVSSVSSIARLWGGMGQVYRVSSKDGDFVVKYMDPRRVSSSSIGDQRKLDSYVVESTFYRDYCEDLISKGVGLARFLHVEREGNRTILCLSVLENAPNDDYYELVLEWLAHFHAATWQSECRGLQEIGTYWHLDTRPDEWDGMSSCGWEGRLKRAARAIDEFLKDETSIQSCVHGDVKDANVMWDGHAVAMCDFQYVGRGCPLKDLCYFLCSNGVADDEEYVDVYYQKLCSKIKDSPPPNRKEFDKVLELCYCDYLRFMCGWGQWGSDITKRVIKMLDKLDGGRDLGSEDAYRDAIRSL